MNINNENCWFTLLSLGQSAQVCVCVCVRTEVRQKQVLLVMDG